MFPPGVKFACSPIRSLEFPSFCCFRCSVVQSCQALCHPMDCSILGFLVHHHLLELAQTHVPWVSDTIQPSHSLSSLFPLAFSLSQYQGLFSASWFFASVGQSIEASASASVPPVNIQNWFPLGLTDLISLLSPRTLKSLLQQHSSKASVLWCLAFFGPTLTSIHDYWKNHSFDYTDLLLARLMSLLFNMLSRFVIAFLPRSQDLLISWLQSLSAVILQPRKIKSLTISIVSPSICHEVIGPDAMILIWCYSTITQTHCLASNWAIPCQPCLILRARGTEENINYILSATLSNQVNCLWHRGLTYSVRVHETMAGLTC